MDFNKEFDAIFKDVIGSFEERVQEEPREQPTVYQRYEDYAKDLVRFSRHILKDQEKLNMYGIQHVLSYLEMKKHDHERHSNFTCKCGKVWCLKIWNEPLRFRPEIKRSLEALDADHISIHADPWSFSDRVQDTRFCTFCGQIFRVEGVIIGMSTEGSPLG